MPTYTNLIDQKYAKTRVPDSRIVNAPAVGIRAASLQEIRVGAACP
jgi:hypothetical protein